MKQIGLALANYEDKRKAGPPITSTTSTAIQVAGQGSGNYTYAATPTDTNAGYSWMVFILPEIEETNLYNSISTNSNRFAIAAFDTAVRNGSSTTSPHASTTEISAFVCPSYSGERKVSGNVGAATNNPPAAYTNKTGGNAGVTNYSAMVGTHVIGSKPEENGALQMRPTQRGTAATGDTGRKISAMSDGTSKTVVVAETKERALASWYDGTTNWLCASKHGDNGQSVGTAIVTTGTGTDSGRLVPVGSVGGNALNHGPSPNGTGWRYMNVSGLNPNTGERFWGPSSDHGGAVINHVLCSATATWNRSHRASKVRSTFGWLLVPVVSQEYKTSVTNIARSSSCV
jgi:hypothetical protein